MTDEGAVAPIGSSSFGSKAGLVGSVGVLAAGAEVFGIGATALGAGAIVFGIGEGVLDAAMTVFGIGPSVFGIAGTADLGAAPGGRKRSVGGTPDAPGLAGAAGAAAGAGLLSADRVLGTGHVTGMVNTDGLSSALAALLGESTTRSMSFEADPDKSRSRTEC